MTTVVDVDGVDIRSAAVLNRDCAFPISNLAQRCPKDEIFADMPIFYDGWEDGTVAPAFTGVEYTITNAANCDPCAPAMARCSGRGGTANLTAESKRPFVRARVVYVLVAVI